MRGTVIIDSLALNNDAQVKLEGAAAQQDGSYFNAATVTFKLLTTAGATAVTSQTLTYDAASNGDYFAAVSSSLFSSLTTGLTYVAVVTASEGGEDGEWRVPIKFDVRLGDYQVRST